MYLSVLDRAGCTGGPRLWTWEGTPTRSHAGSTWCLSATCTRKRRLCATRCCLTAKGLGGPEVKSEIWMSACHARDRDLSHRPRKALCRRSADQLQACGRGGFRGVPATRIFPSSHTTIVQYNTHGKSAALESRSGTHTRPGTHLILLAGFGFG